MTSRALLPPLGLLALTLCTPRAVQAESLSDVIPDVTRAIGITDTGAFDALSGALGDTVARSIPVLAASAGYTYRYNPELEAFERTSATLGPLFLDRPNTLGRGKININVSYQYVQLDELDGQDMDSLTAPAPIIARETDLSGSLIQRSAWDYRYDLSLVNHVAAFSLTYGLFDDLDLNILVPLISTEFDATVNVRRVAVAAPGQPFVPQPGPTASASAGDSHIGVGDILLRGKYELPQAGIVQSAVGLQLRMPSGDEDNFQGTGSFEASPALFASTVVWDRVEPHAAVAVDLNADDVDQSQARYGVGVDVDVTRRVGVALAFLGRSQFTGSAPSGSTDFQHLINGQAAPWPILNTEFDRKDFFDFSFGLRAVVWKQIMVFLNGIFALNDDGLRSSEIIPTFGVEATF